jgi:hypothetical protein
LGTLKIKRLAKSNNLKFWDYINLDDVSPIVIIVPENTLWLNPKPIFNFELTKYKTFEANPLLIHQ